jgi:hypothetical protein
VTVRVTEPADWAPEDRSETVHVAGTLTFEVPLLIALNVKLCAELRAKPEGFVHE